MIIKTPKNVYKICFGVIWRTFKCGLKIDLIIHWVPVTMTKKVQKKLLISNWVLVVTKLFNIAVNDIHAEKSVCYSQVLIVTTLV